MDTQDTNENLKEKATDQQKRHTYIASNRTMESVAKESKQKCEETEPTDNLIVNKTDNISR